MPQSARLIFSANLYVDCRNSKGGRDEPVYLVSDILNSGVLAANTCGTRLKIAPTPGEMILFVRPGHWWEGIKR